MYFPHLHVIHSWDKAWQGRAGPKLRFWDITYSQAVAWAPSYMSVLFLPLIRSNGSPPAGQGPLHRGHWKPLENRHLHEDS